MELAEAEMRTAVEIMQHNFEKYKEQVEVLNTTCDTALQVAEKNLKKSEEMKIMLLKVEDLLKSGDTETAINYLKVHDIKSL